MLAHTYTTVVFEAVSSRRCITLALSKTPSNPLSPGSALSFPGPLKNPRKGFTRDVTLEEGEEKY